MAFRLAWALDDGPDTLGPWLCLAGSVGATLCLCVATGGLVPIPRRVVLTNVFVWNKQMRCRQDQISHVDFLCSRAAALSAASATCPCEAVLGTLA